MNTASKAPDNFLAKIKVNDSGCWEWLGYISQKGYGQLSCNCRGIAAHTFSYELFIGPVPMGLELDHLCNVKHCVNPVHLEPVTQAENMRRAGGYALLAQKGGRARGVQLKAKTHCPQGHPYDAVNTYINKGARNCRICPQLARKKKMAKGQSNNDNK